MQLCGFLNYCYGYWTTVWSLDYCVFTELLTPLTRKWSHNCTYRKMKTEIIISFSTKISQFIINKHLYELRACSEYDQSIGRHFFYRREVTRNATKHYQTIGHSVYVVSVYFSVGVYITKVFEKKKVLMMCILPFLCRLQAEIPRSPGCKVI